MTQLSNVLPVIFLVWVIYATLIRLTDGKREYMTERISLASIALSAFFLIAEYAHPDAAAYVDISAAHAVWNIFQT